MADEPGTLNWRLSAHPITLLTYLGFRIGMLRTTLPAVRLKATPCTRPFLPDG
jgi:hypothetical protein